MSGAVLSFDQPVFGVFAEML